MINQFNPDMLVLAREVRGLTQSQLARATAIDQGLVSRYESGVRPITEKDLSSIASELEFPEAFFFREGRRLGLGSNGLYHRKRQSMPTGQLRELHARVNLLRLDVERLLQGADFEVPYEIPEYPVNKFDKDVEQIAAMVRAAWKLPHGPIPNVVEVIENAGGIIYPCNFGTRKTDAIVQSVPNFPPVFLVNEEIPGDRLRHSLAHELGHLVMHDIPNESMEGEADGFAAAFLMPASDIELDLEPVDLPHLAQIKPYWKVSIQALIRRARDLGKISERQYRSLFEQLSKLGYRTNEPNPIPLEEPTLLKEILDVYTHDYGYTIVELAKLLSIDEEEVVSVYLRSRRNHKLRVVSGARPSTRRGPD